jgi:hypothetical protein
MSSFEKTNSGVTFHCETSRGKSVDVVLTVCAPETLRVRMCPDPELRNVKGMLEIKEDWAACPFTVTESPETVTIEPGALRFQARRDRWKYTIYDRGGEVVLEEHVRDGDVIGAYRAMPIGFTTREG